MILASLGYCDPAPLLLAVIETFHTNDRDAAFTKTPADDGSWVFHSANRNHLYTNVVAAWSRLTRRTYDWFPFSEDIVARLYWRVAKASAVCASAWEREAKAVFPPIA